MNLDYVIQHCDDIIRWMQRDQPGRNSLLALFSFAFRTNPFNFDPRRGYDPVSETGLLSRQTCYEIWVKNT